MIEIIKALSDETRIRIVNLLLYRELCVCDIEGILCITQSNASRHLTKLKTSGIITHDKKAQWVFYQISEDFRRDHNLLIQYLKEQTFKNVQYKNDAEKLKNYAVTCLT